MLGFWVFQGLQPLLRSLNHANPPGTPTLIDSMNSDNQPQNNRPVSPPEISRDQEFQRGNSLVMIQRGVILMTPGAGYSGQTSGLFYD